VITGMTVLAAIGEITRFESTRHLVSYSGLVPGLEQSGVKLRGKKITKEGRKDLRCLHLAAPSLDRDGTGAGTGGRWWK